MHNISRYEPSYIILALQLKKHTMILQKKLVEESNFEVFSKEFSHILTGSTQVTGVRKKWIKK